MPRPTTSVFIAASLDGFVAGPGDDLAFLKSVEKAGEDYGFHAFFGAVDALAIGRRTWEVARGFDTWPYVGKRVVVFTSGAYPTPNGEELVHEDPAVVLDRLGAEGVRRVYVDGGALIRSFLRAKLVDELILSVIPVVLGGGVPLWADGQAYGAEGVRLALSSVEPWFDTGLVQLRYLVRDRA